MNNDGFESSHEVDDNANDEDYNLLQIINQLPEKYSSEKVRVTNGLHNSHLNPLRRSGSGKNKQTNASDMFIQFFPGSGENEKSISINLPNLTKSIARGQSGPLSTDIEQFIKYFYRDLYPHRFNYRNAVVERLERYWSNSNKSITNNQKGSGAQANHTFLFDNYKLYILLRNIFEFFCNLF